MRNTILSAVAAVAALLTLAGCGDDPTPAAPSTSSSTHAASASPALPATGDRTPGNPGNPAARPTTAPHQTTTHAVPTGSWDRNGNPVNGGPRGADGSTGNGLTKGYCAKNQDPACPSGSYVGPNAILSPDGSGNYVPCEGTVCTNPNHGGGDTPAPTATRTTTQPPAATAPRDDDPGNQPCTTGMGESGKYIYSEDTQSWVCQIG